MQSMWIYIGQINAESAGTRHISGAGGQLDFVMGAYLSRGGKSFICCSSTFTSKDGTVHSRIRPTLAEGSIVTDTRANAHYVVTEYGKVCLKGMSTWQRAEALIGIAHPDFRDDLIRDAEKQKIWRESRETITLPRISYKKLIILPVKFVKFYKEKSFQAKHCKGSSFLIFCVANAK